MSNGRALDVVVVGAGHNGLTAACYLAAAGRRVLVVESSPTIGGMTSSCFAIPEAPSHLVHPCAVDVIFLRATSIVEELDLARHGWRTVEPDPAYIYLHPDGTSLAFWRDPARTAEEIRQFSPEDARAYLRFVEVLDALLGIALPMMRTEATRPSLRELFRALGAWMRHRRQADELMALVTGSADQAVVERFEHPVVVSALLCLAGGAGPIDRDGSGLALVLLGLLHRVGVSRPIGGMQKLAEALASRLAELGGEVSTGVAVEEIQVVDGKMRGVRLADGRFIEARAVIATCDPRTALGLVTPGAVERRLLVRTAHAPSSAAGAAPLRIDLALSGQARFSRHHAARQEELDLRRPVALIGTADQVRESFAAAARGELASEPYLWVAIPTGCDPSQAPPGQDVIYLYPPAMPLRPRAGWAASREQAVNNTLAQARRYLDGLEDQELGRWIETPEDLARRLNVTNGCVTHLDFGLLRSGPLRPAWGLGGTTPPVPGFFLGGAGTHPGGGVSGIPGKLASERVNRYLRR